ncbi:MAG: hypothetical protein H6555_12940 [Lewinellaceae bacterium]|nr:hypothetical protein [Lewinellaceae bacterium]
MELKNKIIFILICIGVNTFAQAPLAIKKAKVNENSLMLRICNVSDSTAEAPILEIRHGKDQKYLYDIYYNINQDTLSLQLKREVNTTLVSIRSAEGVEPAGRLFYVDKNLEPKKCFSTKTKIKNLTKIKHFILHYKEQILSFDL